MIQRITVVQVSDVAHSLVVILLEDEFKAFSIFFKNINKPWPLFQYF